MEIQTKEEFEMFVCGILTGYFHQLSNKVYNEVLEKFKPILDSTGEISKETINNFLVSLSRIMFKSDDFLLGLANGHYKKLTQLG